MLILRPMGASKGIGGASAGIARLLAAMLALACVVDAAHTQDSVSAESGGGYTSFSELDVTEDVFFASTELYASWVGIRHVRGSAYVYLGPGTMTIATAAYRVARLT